MYLYRPDVINQYNLELHKNELNRGSENNMMKALNERAIENIRFLRLLDSKEFEKKKGTIIGHLIEELKNKK